MQIASTNDSVFWLYTDIAVLFVLYPCMNNTLGTARLILVFVRSQHCTECFLCMANAAKIVFCFGFPFCFSYFSNFVLQYKKLLNRYGNGKNKFVSEFYAFERINKWNTEEVEKEKQQQQTKYFISIKYEPNRENLLLNECGWLLVRACAIRVTWTKHYIYCEVNRRRLWKSMLVRCYFSI